MINRTCKNCGGDFKVKSYILKVKGRGMYCSRKCANSTPLKLRTGANSHNWNGDSIGYYGIHDWIQTTFGSANTCQSELIGLTCKKISKRFEWAKLKEKEYKRDRGNFIQLCKSCHSRYDIKENTYKGKKVSEETKQKLSKIVKEWWKTKKLKETVC